MKRVEQSEYILIRAYTDSEWDNCDYAVIHITTEWKQVMNERLARAQECKADSGFYYLVYSGGPDGFYKDDEAFCADEILEDGEDCCYIILEQTDLDKLPIPKNRLHLYQMFMDDEGLARFKAFGKNTGEEFYTAEISIPDLLITAIPQENQ